MVSGDEVIAPSQFVLTLGTSPDCAAPGGSYRRQARCCLFLAHRPSIRHSIYRTR